MYYLFIMRHVICLFVYTGKNPRFTAFLDSNHHTQLAIVTENELGLAFPPRNLPKKFRPDPSTFYLVIVVTNKQTDRQTNAGKNIIPRFRGDNDSVTVIAVSMRLVLARRCQWQSLGGSSVRGAFVAHSSEMEAADV